MQYRNGVCALLIKENAVLLVEKRSNEGPYWILPRGGAEPNETETETICRELKEELNLSKDDYKIIRKSAQVLKFDFPKEDRLKLGYAGCKYSVWIIELLNVRSIVADQKELISWRLVPLSRINEFLKFNDIKEIIRNAVVEIR